MKNIETLERQDMTSYRRIAIASWNHPRDPSIYCTLDLDVAPAEAFLGHFEGRDAPTLTHYTAKVLGQCLRQFPAFDQVLLRSQLWRRRTTSVFITTLIQSQKGKDLSGFPIPDIHERSLSEVATRSRQAVAELKSRADGQQFRLRQRIERLPIWLLRPVFRLIDLFQFSFNHSLHRVGIPRDAFGAAMLTNIGALGIDNALIPLSPYTHCPVIIGLGKVRQAPVVRDGEVVVGRRVTVTVTTDHRYVDGAHGAQLLRRFRKIFENPDRFPQVFAP